MKEKIIKRISAHRIRINILSKLKDKATDKAKMSDYLHCESAISTLYKKIEELEWVLSIMPKTLN